MDRNGVAWFTPETLYQLAVNSVVDNFDTCIPGDPSDPRLEYNLAGKISHAIFDEYQKKKKVVDDNILKIFKSSHGSKLREVRLWNLKGAGVKTELLVSLINKNITELTLYEGYGLPENFLFYLNCNSENLKVLSVNRTLYSELFRPAFERVGFYPAYKGWRYVLNAPNLEYLEILPRYYSVYNPSDFDVSCLVYYNRDFAFRLFSNLKKLTHLDLSGCGLNYYNREEDDLSYLLQLPNLTSLVLHNAFVTDGAFQTLKSLRNLEHLDISRGFVREYHPLVDGAPSNWYKDPGKKLKSLVESLPKLRSLDISGTNLDKCSSGKDGTEKRFIYGLQSRIGKPLEFLGVYDTHYKSCNIDDIPAEKITGNANLGQLLNALEAYSGRRSVLVKILDELQNRISNSLNLTDLIDPASIDFNPENVCRTVHQILNSLEYNFYRCPSMDFVDFGMKILKTLLNGFDVKKPVKKHVSKKLANIVVKFNSSELQVKASKTLLDLLESENEVCGVLKSLMNFMFAGGRKEIFCPDDDAVSELTQNEIQEELPVNRSGLKTIVKSINDNLNRAVSVKWFIKTNETKDDQQEMMKSFWDVIGNLINGNLIFSKIFLARGGVKLFSYCLPFLLSSSGAMMSALNVFIKIILQFDLLWRFLKKYRFRISLCRVFSKNFQDSVTCNFHAGFILAKIFPNIWKFWFFKNLDNEEIFKFDVVIADELIESVVELIYETQVPEYQCIAIWGIFNLIKFKTWDEMGCYNRKREYLNDFLKEFIGKNETKYPNISRCAQIICEKIDGSA